MSKTLRCELCQAEYVLKGSNFKAFTSWARRHRAKYHSKVKKVIKYQVVAETEVIQLPRVYQ